MKPSTVLLRAGLLAASTFFAVVAARFVLARLRGRPELVLVQNEERIRDLLEGAEPRPGFEWPEPAELGRRLTDELQHMTPDELALFFPALEGDSDEAAPHVIYRRVPRWDRWRRFPEHPAGGFRVRANDLGLREDEDVRRQGIDLRILVQGDSHVDGLCANRENMASLLELSLAGSRAGVVDVLNVARGAYGPFNYLGTVRAYAELGPKALVLVFYGGNDFMGCCALSRHLLGLGAPRTVSERFRRAVSLEDLRWRSAAGQELAQAIYFDELPEEEALALRIAVAISVELEQQCREAGARLLVAYLPPPSRGAPRFAAGLMRQRLAELGADPELLRVAERVGEAYLSALREQGIATLDLTAPLAASPERPYWKTDQHLSVAGHAVAARALDAELRRLLDL